MTADEFWDSTLAEFRLAVQAYDWREKRQHHFYVSLAWNIAHLSRQRTLPSLKSILPSTREMTPEQIQKDRDYFNAAAKKTRRKRKEKENAS